ncbi:MAG: type 1 glutamine amidotransferase [Hyphomicrobiales bacterium]
MKKIGVLITGHVREELVETYGEYGGFFEKLIGGDGFEFRDYFVVDQEFPKSTDECDAYVLSGSAHGAYEEHAFIPALEKFIQDAYAANIPLVGICFGHQIMAQALGGKVVKYDGGWGLGVHGYQIDLGNGPEPIRINAVHQDQVVELPKGAKVFGSSPFCENAAISYQGKAISFQPHPEFGPEFMNDLIEVRRGLTFSDELSDEAIGTLGTSVDNGRIADYIRDFLRA